VKIKRRKKEKKEKKQHPKSRQTEGTAGVPESPQKNALKWSYCELTSMLALDPCIWSC
jgi:hypothetical protein